MKFRLVEFEIIRAMLPIEIEQNIFKVIQKMENEHIDLDEWELDEIPIDNFYCFFNKQDKEAFDISVENDELKIIYRNNSTDLEAINISEAIRLYRFL